jgi:hypothetical protein
MCFYGFTASSDGVLQNPVDFCANAAGQRRYFFLQARPFHPPRHRCIPMARPFMRAGSSLFARLRKSQFRCWPAWSFDWHPAQRKIDRSPQDNKRSIRPHPVRHADGIQHPALCDTLPQTG